MTTSRRLATEAKIVLEKAGFMIEQVGSDEFLPHYIYAWHPKNGMIESRIRIAAGTVDNAEVERLIEAAKR